MKVFFLKSLNIFLVSICLFCYQSYAKNWQEREVISEETEKLCPKKNCKRRNKTG